MPICASKPRQVYAQEGQSNAGQDPGQKDDWKQEQPLVVFVVVLLTGKQLIGIIDVVEIQVQGRCRWMLEIGGVLPLLTVDRVVVGSVPT